MYLEGMPGIDSVLCSIKGLICYRCSGKEPHGQMKFGNAGLMLHRFLSQTASNAYFTPDSHVGNAGSDVSVSL